MVIVTLMPIWNFAWPEFSDTASKRSFCHFSSRTLTCLSLSPRLSGRRTLTGIVWAGWLIDWSPFHESPTCCTSHCEGAIYRGDRTQRQVPGAPGESLDFNGLLVLRVRRVMPKRIAVRRIGKFRAAGGRGRCTALPLLSPESRCRLVRRHADVYTWTHERQSQSYQHHDDGSWVRTPVIGGC